MSDGLLLIDKPSGVTSHDVVQVVRRALGIRRVGHTGTLDPMAQGLLVVLIGRATKCQHALQAHDKAYEAVLQLGTQTDSADAMGKPVLTAPVPPFDRAEVAALLKSFEGACALTPPAFSAIKVRGRPAYWWARRQQPVQLSSRMVHLTDVTLMACDASTIAFHVQCSAGTYIRSLGEMIAERLGTVGHLTKLVRVRIGAWSLNDAKPLTWIAQADRDTLIRELSSIPIPASV
ncbi:MAG: tRNA pseudouridine(55) synthase TruB [Candidatus Omnitrophica bacterium]|nr:tRNA pseudouridine(55) synthase TruB [Candidatus Omnitrophota bacterium]